MGADGVEGGEAGATAADEERERAIELDDAPGNAAVVGAVDASSLQLELTGLAIAAGGGVDAEVADRLRLPVERVVVELDAGVEGEPAAVGGAGEGVDLRQEQVVLGEEPPEAGEDARELVQFAAGQAEGGGGRLGAGATAAGPRERSS